MVSCREKAFLFSRDIWMEYKEAKVVDGLGSVERCIIVLKSR